MLAVVIIVDKLFHWTKQLVTQMTAIYEQIDNMHEVDVSLTYGWVLKKLDSFYSIFIYYFGPTTNQDASACIKFI